MDDSRLRLFVYGTLKRGCANHRKLCQGVVSVEPAEIGGKLYELPAGYPALVIPASSILAAGSSDPRADVVEQHKAHRPRRRAGATAGGARWDRVHGEVLTFTDSDRLVAFDELEGFRPGRPSLYLRVLAAVTMQAGAERMDAWVYVVKDPGTQARYLPGGCWPDPQT